jgi:hypothetical protein
MEPLQSGPLNRAEFMRFDAERGDKDGFHAARRAGIFDARCFRIQGLAPILGPV